MTYSTCRFLSFIAILLFSSIAGAAAPTGISLPEAFKKALEKTEGMPLQQTLTEQAEERISQTRGRVLPNVSFIATYQRLPSQDSSAGGVGAFRQADQTNARFTLIQPLFRGFGEFAELHSRKLLADAQRLSERQTHLAIYSDVAQTFFGVLASEKDSSNLKVLLELTEKRVVELKGRTKIGRSRKGELLAALSQVATLEAQIQAAESTIEQSREAFSFTTGLETDTPIADIKDEVPPSLPELKVLLDLIEKRPDLEASKMQTEAALESVSVARAQHFPALDFTANYYVKRAGVLSDLNWDVGLSLTVPLFAGGTTQSQVREASEKHKQSELQLARTRRSAMKEVRSVYKALAAQVAQHLTLKTALKIAKDNYEEQNRDYRYGLTTHLDVLQAMNSYQETQRLLDRTRYLALASYASLQAATGQLSEETP